MKKTKDLTENEQVTLLGKSISREIVQEIMNYGVTQQQILDIKRQQIKRHMTKQQKDRQAKR